MAQGGVSGILDYTAGGNVFGILGGGVRTESGHEEWEDYVPVEDGYLYIDVVFSKAFKNAPDVSVENVKVDQGYYEFYSDEYKIDDVTNTGFSLELLFEGASRGGRTVGGSFDWTATGK